MKTNLNRLTRGMLALCVLPAALWLLGTVPAWAQQGFVLSQTGYSHLYWPYTASSYSNPHGWYVSCGHNCNLHKHDDYYAEDYIHNSGNETCGEDFLAPFAGEVIYAGSNGGSYGSQVILRASVNTNFALRIAHLQAVSVFDGQTVSAGTKLGELGATGGNWVCHAHLVLYRNITSQAPNGVTGLANLNGGYPPSGNLDLNAKASTFAAPYDLDAVATGGCQQVVTLTGNIAAGTYQASQRG